MLKILKKLRMRQDKLKIKNKIKLGHFLNKMFLFFVLYFFILLNLNFDVFAEEDLTLENIDNLETEEKINLDEEIMDELKEAEDLNENKVLEKDANEIKSDEENKAQVIDYSETKIRINEILPSANGTDYEKEFVEIYNYGTEDLIGWKIQYNLNTPKDLTEIKAKSFLLIETSRSIKDDGCTIKLISPNSSDIFQEISFNEQAHYGQSLNFDENVWYWAKPTPEKENVENPTTKNYPKIIINEVLPNPEGIDSGNEFIELYNPNSEKISLDGWILKDTSTTQNILKNIEIESKKYLVLYQGKDFSFTLNNDEDAVFLQSPNPDIQTSFSYKNSVEGLSFNFDKNENYIIDPTPGEKNLENPTTKNYSEIRINEIFPNAIGGDDGQEFIELYNPNNDLVELKNWKLEYIAKNKTSNSETKREFIFTDEKIEKKSFLILNNKDNNPIFDLRNNSNEGDFVTLTLISPNPNIQFSISYYETTEGQSYNYDEENWYWTKITPNEGNKENPLTKNYPNLILSEILPNPIGDEENDEFIEIYNPNDFEIDLESWILKDSSASGSYIFNENQKISARAYFTIYRKDFDFALNNSGGEEIYLISPNKRVQSKVDYESAKENVSYNFDLETNTWRWSKFLTPNEKNIFNNLPKIEKVSFDEKIYQDIYTNFEVKSSDLDKDELKFTWDFGDGHKSYKNKTRHKYLKIGVYNVSLKIQDGSEEIIKNFEIKVKKFPKYDLEIVKIMPNPEGLDSLNEYIVIKNNSGQKIDLENWSIATGSDKDKIYNHPIRESLTIKNKKEEIITRKYSAFSLPNKKGYIELRQPDGRVVDRVLYEKEKIQNNESYEKINKEWQWIRKNNLTDSEVQKIIDQALENEKKWQMENFEQKIAEKIVNRNDENKFEANVKDAFWLARFSEKVNFVLSDSWSDFKNLFSRFFENNFLS